MNSSETKTWRTRLAGVVDGAPVQNFVLAVIIVNAVTMGLETAVRRGTPFMDVLHVLDVVALSIFVVEIVLKLVAHGVRGFFREGWNLFDFVVVAVAIIPGSGPLAVLRTLRVLRILRVIKFFPQLRGVVEALMRALPGIGAIAILMVLIYYVSAVMATVLFSQSHPEWFGDLGASVFTLFQVMTLDNWSVVVRPMMETVPYAWAFFVPYILISAFTMLNLFIAVIVDTMQSMRSAQADREPAVEEVAEPAVAPVAQLETHAAVVDLMAEVSALRDELREYRREAS